MLGLTLDITRCSLDVLHDVFAIRDHVVKESVSQGMARMLYGGVTSRSRHWLAADWKRCLPVVQRCVQPRDRGEKRRAIMLPNDGLTAQPASLAAGFVSLRYAVVCGDKRTQATDIKRALTMLDELED